MSRSSAGAAAASSDAFIPSATRRRSSRSAASEQWRANSRRSDAAIPTSCAIRAISAGPKASRSSRFSRIVAWRRQQSASGATTLSMTGQLCFSNGLGCIAPSFGSWEHPKGGWPALLLCRSIGLRPGIRLLQALFQLIGRVELPQGIVYRRARIPISPASARTPFALDRSMQTVIIVIHLMIVSAMIGLVLLQKSEGGGLGMGGGGGGVLNSRGPSHVLSPATAILSAVVFATSLLLSITAGLDRKPRSILQDSGGPTAPTSQPANPGG